MAETKIELSVSGEQAEEAIRKILAEFPGEAVLADDTGGINPVPAALEAATAATGDLPQVMSAWWRGVLEVGGPGLLASLAIIVAVIAGAYAIERIAYSVLAKPADASKTRIRNALAWAGQRILRLALFAIIISVAFRAIGPEGGIVAVLGPILLAAVMRFRIIRSVVDGLAAPSEPARRPTGLSDEDAAMIMTRIVWLLGFVATLGIMRDIVLLATAGGASGALFALATRVLEGIAAFLFFISVRKPVAHLIALAVGDPADAPGLITRAGKWWYILYGVLMVLTVLSDAYGYLLPGQVPGGAASTYSFQIFVLTPFILAGVAIWRRSRLAELPKESRGLTTAFFALIEGGILIAAAALLLVAWGMDPFATDAAGSGRILPGLVSAGVVVVIGISVWRTVLAFLDIYAPEAPEDDGDAEMPDGEGGVGGTRLETIYPILRVSSGIFIGTLTVMLALSAAGVAIGPLIAGAGVLGLAFGFGAQTLVKDVISGMFYLYEDAFRVGEFIETKEGKGSVEKILLRSVRLRHPRGAVYTIPFGSLGTIQNHSRDWVIMKFFFDVAPTEDLERVRKLVKKVGAKLLEDPTIGDKFIEPLKSQGAVAMNGPNFSIGVKFSCRPGDQFAIRRQALVAIQRAIIENDIAVAKPSVTVNTPDGEKATEAAAEAAAAATQQSATAGAHPNAGPA